MNKKDIENLDDLFRDFIRKRAILRTGGCERCLTLKFDKVKEDGSILPSYKQLQCSHFWGRTKKAIRWDEDDAAGLCGACHMYLTAHPPEHTEFFRKRLGERDYDLLEARANKPHKPDIELITLKLKDLIAKLEVKE